MSDKSDRDLLIETHTIVNRIDSEIRVLKTDHEKTKDKVVEIDKKIYWGAGFIAAAAVVWESIKAKIFG